MLIASFVFLETGNVVVETSISLILQIVTTISLHIDYVSKQTSVIQVLK